MIKRNIEEKIVKDFKRNKIITLLGPRQVGKTTLLEQITEGAGNIKILTLNCDDQDDRTLLQGRSSTEINAQMYFWRTQAQQEIDYVDECDGRLSTFEFKWNPKSKATLPKVFTDAYPGATFEVITPESYEDFLRIS